jgi:hypothetical protein
MKTTDEIHAELLRFAEIKLKVPAERLAADPSFEEMSVDSLTKLEILLHGDDTFGSHVLDYLEDGLLKDSPPTRLSELAMLITKCMRPPKEVFLERKAGSAMPMGTTIGSGAEE